MSHGSLPKRLGDRLWKQVRSPNWFAAGDRVSRKASGTANRLPAWVSTIPLVASMGRDGGSPRCPAPQRGGAGLASIAEVAWTGRSCSSSRRRWSVSTPSWPTRHYDGDEDRTRFCEVTEPPQGRVPVAHAAVRVALVEEPGELFPHTLGPLCPHFSASQVTGRGTPSDVDRQHDKCRGPHERGDERGGLGDGVAARAKRHSTAAARARSRDSGVDAFAYKEALASRRRLPDHPRRELASRSPAVPSPCLGLRGRRFPGQRGSEGAGESSAVVLPGNRQKLAPPRRSCPVNRIVASLRPWPYLGVS